MKRTISFSQPYELENQSLANCLMLLSRTNSCTDDSPSRVFECRTCNRQFTSFQALGGHRASHKKPKMNLVGNSDTMMSPTKPKTHECSICGLEFAIGQALGGHMRRHRAVISENGFGDKRSSVVMNKSSSSSRRRVLCLDLNLTPYENNLEFSLGRPSGTVFDCLY